MHPAGPTWIVLARDVSRTVRIEGQLQVVVSLVLDAETGYAQGFSVAPTRRAACAEALQTALTKPVGPLPPQPPGRVFCGPGQAVDVTGELTRLLGDQPPPSVIEAPPTDEAEDIFDSLVGHMAGRRQPEESPTPPDWLMLISYVREYCQAEPWLRWADDMHLDLIVRIAGAPTRYVAV